MYKGVTAKSIRVRVRVRARVRVRVRVRDMSYKGLTVKSIST